MRQRIFNLAILFLAGVLILPACSKKKEPASSAPLSQKTQEIELPELAQNKIAPNPHLAVASPDFGFEEASNTPEPKNKKAPTLNPSDSLSD